MRVPPGPLPALPSACLEQLPYKVVAGKMELHLESGSGDLSLLARLRHPPRFYLGQRRQEPDAWGLLDPAVATSSLLCECARVECPRILGPLPCTAMAGG